MGARRGSSTEVGTSVGVRRGSSTEAGTLSGLSSRSPSVGSPAGARNFFLHFDSVITINRRNLAPPTLPDVLVTGR